MSVNRLVTECMVTALPVNSTANRYFAVWVQWAGGDRYVVSSARGMQPADCWDAISNDWTYRAWYRADENDYSDDAKDERGLTFAEHCKRTRFDFDTAVAIAERVAPTVTVNGRTVTDALAGDFR